MPETKERPTTLEHAPVASGISARNITKAYVEQSTRQQKRIETIGRFDRNRWRKLTRIVRDDA